MFEATPRNAPRQVAAWDLGDRPEPPLWEQHARQWARVKPPLRPCEEDLAPARTALQPWHAGARPAPTVLILGVTPELAALDWPAGARIVATDLSMPMIRGVWPTGRCQAFHRAALQADWFTLPLGNQSCDLVLGDGSFVVFDHAKASRLTRSVRRVLKRGGRFLVRVFVRLDADEPPALVWDHLLARRIGNFHVFDWPGSLAEHIDRVPWTRFARTYGELLENGVNRPLAESIRSLLNRTAGRPARPTRLRRCLGFVGRAATVQSWRGDHAG